MSSTEGIPCAAHTDNKAKSYMKSDLAPDKVEVHRAFATDQAIDVLRFAHDALSGGQACALITLVEIDGGSARSLGAHMAVTAAGAYCGTVSGGCVEGVAAREALTALAEGCDKVVRLGKGSAYFDLELPCGGGINLAIHIIREPQVIEAVLNAHSQRRCARLIYDPEKKILRFDEAPAATGWSNGVFCTNYHPSLRIVLFSQGLEGDMLEQAAQALKIETRRDLPKITLSEIDRYTAIIFLQHDVDKEIPVLQVALQSQAFYIGCLGSRRTHAVRSQILLKNGFSQQQIDRIAAPVGLFGPVRDACSLAVSVLGEIMSRQLAAGVDLDVADD